MQKEIWIDTDLAVGKEHHLFGGPSDVDDGFAVLQLVKAKDIVIKGMSAVYGNTPLENAYPLCQYMSKNFMGDKVPVYKGAASPMVLKDLKTNEAVAALANQLKQQPMMILAIGPATNVGLLVMLYPELASRIKEVVLVAGRRKHTDHFSIGNQGVNFQDLNFDLDNEAFSALMQHKVPITLCPFELSHKVWLGQESLDRLAKGSVGCQWLAKHAAPWLKLWHEMGVEAFNPFDLLASHYLVAPEDIHFEQLYARLEAHLDDTVDNKAGNVFKQYLICDSKPGYPVKYCYDVVPGFYEKLMTTFGV